MNPLEVAAGIAVIATLCIWWRALRIARRHDEEMQKLNEARLAAGKANWERRVAATRRRES